MNNLDKNYWDMRNQAENTPWNLGQISPPLKQYFDQISNKNIHILIPGAGHSHEVNYLAKQCFEHITVCDISTTAIEKIKQNVSDYHHVKLVEADFFALTGCFDLIVEQTFFCALDPALRAAYVEKMYELLPEGGTLVGLLFATPFAKDGPPFGGSKEEYLQLFGKKFHIKKMEICYNSVLPRQGNELFFICKKVVI
jgi:thiopurine S-methyltransferase